MNRGIALLVVGAAATATGPLLGQLVFAVFGIGVVGMVHGAGDLAVVEPNRRSLFLVVYGFVSLLTLLWWTVDPAIALPAFLVASAVHFGMEDAPNGSIVERVARGVALVATPATLHLSGYAALLRIAGGRSWIATTLTPFLAGIGGAAGIMLLLIAYQRRNPRLAGGITALLVLPPLIGFTLGFLILHALPQTGKRRDRLGCSSTTIYLQAVAPVFAGAVLLSGIVVALLLHFDPSGVRGLFAGIAALAVPHLLVTPWFEERTVLVRPALARSMA